MDSAFDFVIDTTGQNENEAVKTDSNTSPEDDVVTQLLRNYESSLKNNITNVEQNPEIPKTKPKKQLPYMWNHGAQKKDIANKIDLQAILKKSVITPDFEKLHSVPAYEESKKKLREQRKKEREKTKGSKWFGLPATEMTDEIKNDLEVLQMRSALDPKHFYKKNDFKVLPKYFQIGKVMDSPLDYYNNRLTRKERKRTLVDELLADAEFNKYNKRKYREIIEERQKTHYKAYRQAKKLKRKKNK